MMSRTKLRMVFFHLNYPWDLVNSIYFNSPAIFSLVFSKLNKNTLGVKKVRGQSEAALQIGMYDQKL